MAERMYANKRSASLVAIHRDRKVKGYVVLEVELQTVSSLNAWATAFLSIGCSLTSLAIGLWSGLFIDSAPSEEARKYGPMMEIAFASLGILFFVLAGCAIWSRKSTLDRIKEESAEEEE